MKVFCNIFLTVSLIYIDISLMVKSSSGMSQEEQWKKLEELKGKLSSVNKPEPAKELETIETCKSPGLYKIVLNSKNVTVLCDNHGNNGLIIMRRINGLVDFFRGWDYYVSGFGDMKENEEFWIGLENVAALTASRRYKLYIYLHNFYKQFPTEIYDDFLISGSKDQYKLISVGSHEGLVDSLSQHVGMRFTTKDRDNDNDSEFNLASKHLGAWWFDKDDARSHLNAEFSRSRLKGMIWKSPNGEGGPIRTVTMKLVAFGSE